MSTSSSSMAVPGPPAVTEHSTGGPPPDPPSPTPTPTSAWQPADRGSPDGPVEALRSLRRAGRLAAEYPLAGRLLAELGGGLDEPGDEFVRTGRHLERVGADAVLREHPETPVVSVAVTGHGTLRDLVPPLHAELARHGLLLRPYVGGFNGYVAELIDPDGDLAQAAPDIVAVLLTPAMIFEKVGTPWRPDDVARVLAENLRLVEGVVGAFCAAQPHATVVLNTLPLLRQHTAQLVDARSRAALGALWREHNAALLRLPERQPRVVVVDLDPLIAASGPAVDPRLAAYTQSHLSPGLLRLYARELGHLARAQAGRTRKTLVLDLDETVWGGVLGEVGPAGVEVGTGYRGEAFAAFQRVARQLMAQGVLLAAVSKNDVEPVRQVLREHPGMVLGEDDFVRVNANWLPKHDNLADLARALNLGVDSFVFVDDSPYEAGLVRRELPAVAVVRVDDEPALHVERLLRDGWFDVRELTAEDRTRTAKYREDLVRSDFLDTFSSLEDYLRELGVQVRLASATEPELARVAQLTARTNQFNLTTRRLQPQQVADLAADPAWSVLGIRGADRFGDNGLVGAVFTRRDDDLVHIDNFLLSCRVFARGIEQACLTAVLRAALAAGASAVTAGYRPTSKNSKVRDFYPRAGFQLIADHGGELLFRHDLTEISPPPEHVELTTSLTGASA